ncbi:hypothetical protein [Bhargavaea massiliensis]|nr:hypothetical protein [Bhargavaea massiliensis]
MKWGMDMAKKEPFMEETYEDRKLREELGRRTNAGFARLENMEMEAGAIDLPTDETVLEPLSEEEIKRRVGSGNYEAAKDDKQTGSINS